LRKGAKPLNGKTVLVTRPKGQSESAVAELERLGATVYVLAVIQIEPLESTAGLDEALRNLERYDWVVLTSVNGVQAVGERLLSLGIPTTQLASLKLATIGPATGAKLEKLVRKPDLIPAEYVSESIAEGLGDVQGKRLLLARADIARKDLANILRERGAVVDEVAAYRIVQGTGSEELPEVAPDYVTLTSSSAARSTYDILKQKGRQDWMESSAIVTIGPITSDTVRELGFQVAAEAKEYTLPGLVSALVDLASETPQRPNASTPSELQSHKSEILHA
jgi:uroporphyrinogen-III synthase